MTEDERHEVMQEAVLDPWPGDRFHEMYSYWVDVIAVDEQNVTWRSSTEDLAQVTPRAEWVTKWQYESIPGKFWVMLHTRGGE